MRTLWSRLLIGVTALLVVAWSSAPKTTAPAPSLAVQQLVCRGGPGLKPEVYKDSSPDDPRRVRAVLRYRRQTTAAGNSYEKLESGACTWNPTAYPNFPVEPGIVYFDIPREAQPWSSKEKRLMDTTIDAAAFFPDLISLPRYLADPSKRFVFFADDKTNLSVSFGAYKSTVLQPTYVTITGSLTREPPKTADVATLSLTRELRCRGGPEGLAFSSGTSAGANLMKMALAYRVASVEFGATGRGIGPGMCAWVQRDAR